MLNKNFLTGLANNLEVGDSKQSGSARPSTYPSICNCQSHLHLSSSSTSINFFQHPLHYHKRQPALDPPANSASQNPAHYMYKHSDKTRAVRKDVLMAMQSLCHTLTTASNASSS